MGTESKQLNLDLFDVRMTLRAFRDSRYQSTAFAVAELIDNSVDAEATFVEVLFVERPQVVTTNEVLRVSEIAVADNGYGMTGETLVTALGQHAGRNTGISVVREGRELVRVAPMVGRHDERNRWWGCEISFDSALDGLFGVDHNKQMASHLTSIVEGFADIDRLSYKIADEAGEDSPWMPLYEIVRDIRDNTAAMRREVERTLKQRGTQAPNGKETKTPTSVSVGVATKGSRRVEEEGEVSPTSTDRDRERMDDESKAQEHKKELESRGYDEVAAERLAQVMVERGDRYAFVSDNVPGSHMFSVKSRAGVIWVTLNIDHPAYDLLRELEESLADLEESSSLSNACVTLRLLLLSWASAEDQYHDPVQRMRVQDVAGTWGRYAATFFDVERAELGE